VEFEEFGVFAEGLVFDGVVFLFGEDVLFADLGEGEFGFEFFEVSALREGGGDDEEADGEAHGHEGDAVEAADQADPGFQAIEFDFGGAPRGHGVA
jgi:hypothetical protein